MNEIKDGGPAFPAPAGVAHITEQGMSLRDWMAGMAMHGLFAAGGGKVMTADEWAAQAYTVADAMIEARGQA